MWNNVFRPISTDDYDLRFFDCEIEYVNPGHEQNDRSTYIQIGHYAGYDLVGRTEVEPLPIDPDFKKTDRLWLFGSVSAARAAGSARHRASFAIATPIRAGRRHLGPGIRHAARATSERVDQFSTATGAQTCDPDHYSGFNPKTEAVQLQVPGRERDARDGSCRAFARSDLPDRRRRQRMPRGLGDAPYVHRRGDAASRHRPARQRARSKTPSSTWTPKCGSSRTSTHTIRRAQLWRTHIYWLAYRDRPVPDAQGRNLSVQARVRRRRGLASTCSRVSRRCAICRASKRPSANAGTSTWARWTRISSPPRRW